MTDYDLYLKSLDQLIKDTTYEISILSNFCAYLYEILKQINWIGFYINKNNRLYLGPFQGKPACVEIPFSKGVCGRCATTKQPISVPNVCDFKGHIACDAQSESEVCIPIIIREQLYGVLDVDSPVLHRFTSSDIEFLEQTVLILIQRLEKIL